MSRSREEQAERIPHPPPEPSIDWPADLLGFRKKSAVSLGKSGYPRRPTQPKTQKRDECLMVEGLSALEQAAMKALGLNEEIVLKRPSLKQAYRRLVLTLHPDRHPPGLSPEEKRRRTEEFQAIHEAYTVLDQAFRRLPRNQQ